MFAPMTMLMPALLAVAPSVDQPAWFGLRWGMTEDEVHRQLGDQPDPQRPGGWTGDSDGLQLANQITRRVSAIGGLSFTGRFGFNADRKLVLLMLTTLGSDACATAQARLQQSYGATRVAPTSENGITTYRWSASDEGNDVKFTSFVTLGKCSVTVSPIRP